MLKQRIAVIGSGIAGLGAAYELSKRTDVEVTLFEAARRLGGHSYTVDAEIEGHRLPVDMGFLVHNDHTYPNLCRLFDELQVPVHPSDMSFSVRIENKNIEWCGTDLSTVFSQKSNFLKFNFYRMLVDILRFNRRAHNELALVCKNGWTLGELLHNRRYSNAFMNWYLVPMGAAIWSTPYEEMLNFPAETFLRFCINHGLLQVNNRPRWKTVLGGSKVYVQKMAERIHHVRTGCPVVEVKRDDDGVELVLGHGNERFDFAVMACHADQSLKILGAAALEPERQVLSAVDYTDNTAVLHLDRSFLPKREKAWAAWNYVAPAKAQADSPLSVTYLLNMLQPLKTTAPVLCTLNPHRTIDPTKILHEVHFRHPRFNHAAIQAQRHLPHIQGLDRLWFCGAWTRYGFHEDGYLSALHVVDHMNKLLNSRHQTDSLANSASVVS